MKAITPKLLFWEETLMIIISDLFIPCHCWWIYHLQIMTQFEEDGKEKINFLGHQTALAGSATLCRANKRHRMMISVFLQEGRWIPPKWCLSSFLFNRENGRCSLDWKISSGISVHQFSRDGIFCLHSLTETSISFAGKITAFFFLTWWVRAWVWWIDWESRKLLAVITRGKEK